MRIRYIRDEDFSNYKKISMLIGMGVCDWKCCEEANIPVSVCQNSELARVPELDYPIEEIFKRYINNHITKSIVLGGLEPLLRKDDVLELIKYFRDNQCEDDIVIYTGYYQTEVETFITDLLNLHVKNIYIKFGRYVPELPPHKDDILGVQLISSNQYGIQIC